MEISWLIVVQRYFLVFGLLRATEDRREEVVEEDIVEGMAVVVMEDLKETMIATGVIEEMHEATGVTKNGARFMRFA